MNGLRVFIAVLGFSLMAAASAEQFLCVVDDVTGFIYKEETKTWEHTLFTSRRKYVLSKAEKEQHKVKGKYIITEVGETRPQMYCKEDFNSVGVFVCDDFAREFRFSKRNGRFLFLYKVGYYHVDERFTDAGSDTPAIAIGKCSPF